jgi:hypothetical protein
MQFVFKSSGIYLGFISGTSLFSRDGEYLGWIEGLHVWDPQGRYRGQLWSAVPNSPNKYVITNRFRVAPVPRPAKPIPAKPPLPAPPANLAPVILPTGWADAF